jgi:hypothetical protein
MIFYFLYLLTIFAKTLNIFFYFLLSFLHKIVNSCHLLSHTIFMFFHYFFNIIKGIISLHFFHNITNPLFHFMFNHFFSSFISFINHFTFIFLFLRIRLKADPFPTETKIFKSLQSNLIIFLFFKADNSVALFDHHPLYGSCMLLQELVNDDGIVMPDGNFDHIIIIWSQ